MYKSTIRPLLFLLEPERAHRLTFNLLKKSNRIPFLRRFLRSKYQYEEEKLICKGIVSKNRIGLSAGMDKGAEVFNELFDFGFGFIEVGTVTPHAWAGNPVPRIFRLPRYNSLISRTGFNNPGVEVVKKRLRYRSGKVTIGVNINKDPQSEGQQVIEDFLHMYMELYTNADYFTINWGTLELQQMKEVLEALTRRRESLVIKRPILLKLPGDITHEGMDTVLEVIAQYGLDGVIATGPTNDRSQIRRYSEQELNALGAGGVSGKGLGMKPLLAVDYLRRNGGKDLLIIGAGGVMTPGDACRMISMGADFVQIYSAFIYEGPGIVADMIQAVADMNEEPESPLQKFRMNSAK